MPSCLYSEPLLGMSHIRSFWDAICLSTLRKRLEKCVSPGGGFNNFIGMTATLTATSLQSISIVTCFSTAPHTPPARSPFPVPCSHLPSRPAYCSLWNSYHFDALVNERAEAEAALGKIKLNLFYNI